MKIRVIAAIALLPLLVIMLFVAPKFCTAIFFGLISAVSAFELTHGTGLVKNIRFSIYSTLMGFWACAWSGFGVGYGWMVLGILVFWCVMFADVMIFHMKTDISEVNACMTAGVILPLMFGAVVRIHSGELGVYYVAVPFIMAFMSDSGGYFGGYLFGKHKLAPDISPKKTMEGVVGGIVCSMLGMVIFCLVLQLFCGFKCNYLYALVYGIAGSLAAVFGDLCFSVIKRQTGIKDYGKLIPGHGGILDRFDSMMVVAPLAEMLLLLLPLAVKV